MAGGESRYPATARVYGPVTHAINAVTESDMFCKRAQRSAWCVNVHVVEANGG